MPAWKVWLMALGKAIWQEVPQAVVGMVPFGENLYRVGERFHWNLREVQPPAQDRPALAELVNVGPQELHAQAEAVANAIAPEAPPEARSRLAATLELAAPLARRTLTRAADPSGKTVPSALRLDGPRDLLPFVPPAPPRFQPGLTFKGWVMTQRLGIGGFSEVWKISHPDDDGLCDAVKFFTDAEARDRLGQHEVAVLKQVRRLESPGVVKLKDFDVSADPPWIRFEYADGGDLISHAKHFYGMKSIPLIRKLAEIVGRCHRLVPPIVHRDLKPGNVLMIRSEGGRLRPVIADFGIGSVASSWALEQGHKTTRPTAALPTMLAGSHTGLYASPQQKAGEGADPRDDVYALGVLWYQLLIGDLSSDAPSGLWTEELNDLGLPAGLIRLLGTCVEPKKLERRPKDAAELAEKIAAFQQPVLVEKVEPVKEVVPPPPPSGRKLPGVLQGERQQAAREVHGRARDHEKVGQYSAAVAEIEALPEHLQEPGYLKSLRDRAIEVAALEEEITRLDGEARLAWRHQPKIERWKQLVPPMAKELDGLLARLPIPDMPVKYTSPVLKMPMVLVPPGEFWMGGGDGKCGEKRVVVPKPFHLGVYPVTQGQWKAVMGNNPSHFSRGGGGAAMVQDISEADLDLFPVERVSWDDVQGFLTKLNAQETGNGWLYRLPTEEEWEYSCRGPVPSPASGLARTHCSFSFYLARPTNALTSDQANFNGNFPVKGSKGHCLGRTTTVGSYPANALGIHDLHGNVWEWTHTPEGSGRVIRGGSWDFNGSFCPAAYRNARTTGSRYAYLGFRLARVPSGQ